MQLLFATRPCSRFFKSNGRCVKVVGHNLPFTFSWRKRSVIVPLEHESGWFVPSLCRSLARQRWPMPSSKPSRRTLKHPNPKFELILIFMDMTLPIPDSTCLWTHRFFLNIAFAMQSFARSLHCLHVDRFPCHEVILFYQHGSPMCNAHRSSMLASLDQS